MSNEQLALRIKAGEDVADNMLKLWEQNQGMIEELAGKYCYMAEKEDLKQEAYFAICKAVDSYDPDKGSRCKDIVRIMARCECPFTSVRRYSNTESCRTCFTFMSADCPISENIVIIWAVRRQRLKKSDRVSVRAVLEA